MQIQWSSSVEPVSSMGEALQAWDLVNVNGVDLVVF